MKRIIIIFAILQSLLLVACSKVEGNTQYDDMMSKGKSSVIEEEYDKAIDYFNLALEEKKGDKEATNLIKQLKLLIDLTGENTFDNIDIYFIKLDSINKINNIKTNTSVVKDKANEYKEILLNEMDKFIDNLEEMLNDGEYEGVEEDLENFIDNLDKMEGEEFKDRFNRCKKLLDDCKKNQKEENDIKEEDNTWYPYEGFEGDAGDAAAQAYCNFGSHYTNISNMLDENPETGYCKGHWVRRNLMGTYSYEDCNNCGKTMAVNPFDGKCQYCGSKQGAAIKEITDSGIIIYEDGTRINGCY
ncbi:MAG: hypothetical protein Q4E31_11395 [Intestinibacter bartlettii]|uniref:hypothetical protein n=1 Tax=Intestinibacter bartlettii TaxID=261299 RepID=UPI0026F20A58|nr:hypothetical protein [Intestinibacter bartlettii]MDO5011421.1 hypothetical protein [Intestinibacter bartlettii]